MRVRNLMIGLAALSAASPSLAADPIVGRWITEEKDAVITIGKCGATYCGKISKFLVPPPEGIDQRDVNNPNKNLRKRKLLGLPVLTSFKVDGDVWRGRIYDPKAGKDYRSVLERVSSNRLKVKGCIGPFCQSQNWTRAR